mmetsp:Transcript_6590/g.26488  ORF Transcript_6590/g.26488 Transcript_6590/m.26488 type:complete len:169 (+) Transcript_6590:2271-2777(+)
MHVPTSAIPPCANAHGSANPPAPKIAFTVFTIAAFSPLASLADAKVRVARASRVPRPAIVVASSRRARPASNGTRAKPRRARARRSTTRRARRREARRTGAGGGGGGGGAGGGAAMSDGETSAANVGGAERDGAFWSERAFTDGSLAQTTTARGRRVKRAIGVVTPTR